MKKIAWLFLVVLGSMTLMHAQSSRETMTMSGTICRSSSVVQQSKTVTRATQPVLTKQADAVFVDDKGEVHQIAQQSQPMCESHMNKHVKAKMQAVPSESNREQEFRIMQLSDQIVGG